VYPLGTTTETAKWEIGEREKRDRYINQLLLEASGNMPPGSVGSFASIEFADCRPLLEVLMVRPEIDARNRFLLSVRSLMVLFIEGISDTGPLPPMESLRREVAVVCTEISERNFDAVPPITSGFSADQVRSMAHSEIDEIISLIGPISLPGSPERTFLIADAMASLLQARRYTDLARISTSIVSAAASFGAERYKASKGRPKERSTAVIETLAAHAVAMAREWTLRDPPGEDKLPDKLILPRNDKGHAAGSIDIRNFPLLNLTVLLRDMALDRTDRHVRHALKAGKIGKREASAIRDAMDDLRGTAPRKLIKALRAAKLARAAGKPSY